MSNEEQLTLIDFPDNNSVSDDVMSKHQRLTSTLDILRDTADWREFMSNVEELIPGILSRGGTSKEDFNKTFVAQLGFNSWKSYVTAPQASSGLGWKESGWRGYQRAWGFCKEYPWLLDSGMKPGTINAFVARCKKEGIDVPVDIDSYEELKEQWKAESESTTTATITSKEVKLTFWQWLTYWFR